ncbi:MAG: ABC transporter permease [Gemmatimonadaceae bacterium]|nr:ABC transporter permease [Gemmatimonadaceae bacterium]
MRNITLAFRMLLKTPFVSTVAILSLALGIGANAAIYSLFDQLLIRSLPVHRPEQLVNLTAPGVMYGSNSCNQQGDCDEVWSYPMFRDLESQQTALSGIAASRIFGASLSIDNEPSLGQGVWVSGQFFSTLGVQPALGRLIGPSDDVTPLAHDVVVLSHDLWRDRFGMRTDVVGKTMIVNGRTMEIIGVTPQSFLGHTVGTRPSVYVPLTMRGAFQTTTYSGYENRRDYWLYVFGRLKEGSSMEQAAAGLNAVYRPILLDVEAPLQAGMSEPTLELFKSKQVLVAPGRQGQSDINDEARTPLYMLFGVTGVVLLIACANIANLLLARGANRSTEMGVRLALGAKRGHLITQLLTEAVILALAGGVVSILVAKLTLDAIASFLPPEAATAIGFTVNGSVVVFAAALAVATGLIFGLFPAMHSTRADLISTIRAGAGQLTGGKAASRFRTVLVTVQISLSMALLVSAGLFLKSLRNVSAVDLGIATEGVVTFAVTPSRVGYDTLRAGVLLRRISEELQAIPGVTGVTSSMVPMVAGSNWGTDVRVQGFECLPDTDCNSRYTQVGPDFFEVMDLELIAGRGIQQSDIYGSTPVAVVNETFARKFNLGDEPVGKFMGWGRERDSLRTMIVGYVKDVVYSEVKGEIPPVFYAAWQQDGRANFMNFYVRTALPPEQLLTAIPTLIKRLEPAMPVEDLKTMPQQIRENVFLDRMISILSASFAILATILASIGLYGVLAYSVSQRTREIGVRMALGADGSNVRALVLKQVAFMVVVGGSIGVLAAFGLGRAAQSLLFQLEGHDPVVFGSAVLFLSCVALLAGLIPALRASRVDPMHALRYD